MSGVFLCVDIPAHFPRYCERSEAISFVIPADECRDARGRATQDTKAEAGIQILILPLFKGGWRGVCS